MKKRINFSQFVDGFYEVGRTSHFSYDAKRALFDHITGLEEDFDYEVEFDPAGLCSEWTEYANFDEYAATNRTHFEDVNQLALNEVVVKIAGTKGFLVYEF